MDNDRALVGADDSDLVEVAGAVGSDERRQSFVEVFDEYRVVERVVNGLIADTVPSCAVDDSWLCHKLPCLTVDCKITCDIAGPVSLGVGAGDSMGWRAMSRHCAVVGTTGSRRSTSGPTSSRVLA